MNRLQCKFSAKTLSDREIVGHGSVFGNVDLGGDIVVKGAFARSIARHKKEGTLPSMLWSHDPSQLPIGAWTDMGEDDKGLALKGELADTQMGNDVRTLVMMGALQGLSIGYMPIDVDYDKQGNRLLKEIDLWEVSVVVFPMNPRAMIEAAKSQFGTPRTLESFLREAGRTKSEAREVVHEVFSGGVRLTDTRCEAEVMEAAKAIAEKLQAAALLATFNRSIRT